MPEADVDSQQEFDQATGGEAERVRGFEREEKHRLEMDQDSQVSDQAQEQNPHRRARVHPRRHRPALLHSRQKDQSPDGRLQAI